MSDSFIIEPGALASPVKQKRKVLVTGAAGHIGSYFAKHSHERYDLTLSVRDEQEAEAVKAYGRAEVADLGDLERLKEIFKGVDTVLHLAANASPRATWEPLLESNVIGTYNVFVAAEAAGCRRVVFASSIHAVSGYSPDRQIQGDDPVSPGDLYGVSKCFGEAMGRYMATQRNLSTLCLRIGGFQPVRRSRRPDVSLMNAFISQRDLNQLIGCCIDDERLRFGIFHGLSNNRFNRMNIDEARELLGYQPQDDFTEENPQLESLELAETVTPHSEQGRGSASGIREELGRSRDE